MPVGPVDFLNAAEKFYNAAADEIEFRAAANRAYYSIFHACNDLYKTQKYNLIRQPGNMGMHAQLYSAFTSANEPRCVGRARDIQKIGYMAKNTLKPLRTTADYDIEGPFGRLDAEAMISRAKLLLDEISKL